MRRVLAVLGIVTLAIGLYACRPAPTPIETPGVRGIPGDIPDVFAVAAHVDRDDYSTALRGITGVELNSHLDVYWANINPTNCGFGTPTPDCMDYSTIDDALARADSQTINYVNGVSTERKLWISVPVFWTQHGSIPYTCESSIPGYIPTPYAPTVRPPTPHPATPTATPHPEVVPPFDTAAFTDAYTQTIKLLGERYNSDARLAGVFLALGYNNETSLNASWCGVGQDVANDYISDWLGGEYDLFVRSAINAAHAAFPDKPVYILAAPAPADQMRCAWFDGASGFTGIGQYANPHMGFGFNGMNPDVPYYVKRPVGTATPTWSNCSSGAVIDRYKDILPFKAEPASNITGGTDRESKQYWAHLFALSLSPDFEDVSPGWFCVNTDGNGDCATPLASQYAVMSSSYAFPAVTTPRDGVGGGDFGAWIERQYGQNKATATDLWTAFRTTEYPWQGTYCQGYCQGRTGNYNHYLTPVGTAWTVRCASNNTGGGTMDCSTSPALPTPASNPYSRFAGLMTASTLSFVVPNTLAYYSQAVSTTVRIAYVNDGADDFCVAYQDAAGVIQSVTVDRTTAGGWSWAAIPVTLKASNAANLGNGAVQIRYGQANCSPGATAARPTLHMVWLDVDTSEAIPTPTVTPTLTPGGPTATPTPTEANTPTPTPTFTFTPTPGGPTATPTMTPDAGAVLEFSEVSAAQGYNWLGPGTDDGRSTFIEVHNTGAQGVDCSGCLLFGDGIGAYQVPDGTIILPGEYYVIAWGADIGEAVPVTGTVTLAGDGWDISAVIASEAGAGLSWQYDGATWADGLPTPGRAYDYWDANPTPTAIP